MAAYNQDSVPGIIVCILAQSSDCGKCESRYLSTDLGYLLAIKMAKEAHKLAKMLPGNKLSTDRKTTETVSFLVAGFCRLVSWASRVSLPSSPSHGELLE